MKIVENISLNGVELSVGWLDSEIDEFTHATIFRISDLDHSDILILSSLNEIIMDRNPGVTFERKLIQITPRQHLSEERILCYIKGTGSIFFTGELKILTIESMNVDEINVYNEFKNMCNALVN